MQKIAITGASGTIGSVLLRRLEDLSITPLDLPEYDLREYETVRAALAGHDAVVHLAWNTQTDNAGSDTIDPDNSRMFSNIYRAALAEGVRRVIMASSVHAHTLMAAARPQQTPISPHASPEPNNPYGAHKLFMEALGKYWATRGLEVVCIRFGGVTPDDTPIEHEEPMHLSHGDLAALIHACIEQPMRDPYAILWGMSRGALPYYDLSNPFGWAPQDSI